MINDPTLQRERLLRFIGNFYPPYERSCLAFRIYGHSGFSITFDDLTDEALERVAERLRSDFWFSKKIRRQNREHMASRKSEAA